MTLKSPTAEIISTGTEILQGLYPDRNASNLSRLLDSIGFRVRYHHATRDHVDELEALLAAAASRSDVLVMTGGLGPTEDDINRHAIARLWSAPLEHDPVAERMMRERFEARKLPMPERNVIQAMIPRGATVFYNYHGTAPGFGLSRRTEDGAEEGTRPVAALVALPGPPREWNPMWERDAAPWLVEQFPHRTCRRIQTLHVALLPESTINDRVRDLFTADPRLELTLLADRGHIRARCIATGDDEAEADVLVKDFADRVCGRLPPETILRSREAAWSIEEELAALLRGTGRTVTVAESCTGGMVAARITDVPGASEFLGEAFVTYSNEAKRDRLGVLEETLGVNGAVSRECVLEMASGARRVARADAAVAVSGIAGPTGGTPDKPVGTVWFAIDAEGRPPCAIHRRIPGGRDSVREWACRQALDLLRRWADNLAWPD